MIIDYRLVNGGALKLPDNLVIPEGVGIHWNQYQEWLNSGNSPQPEYTLQERRERRRDEVVMKAMSVMGGDIDLGSSKIIHSTPEYSDKYNRHAGAVERGSSTTSFSIMLKDYSTVTLTKLELDTANKLTSELHAKCEQKCDSLIGEVMSSDNPESVDIDTGWPVVPYSG